MAKKMYYTEQEAAAKLGLTTQELAAMVADQKLRVYQDGARKMFKVEEIDALAGPQGEEITLAPADTGDTISLTEADSIKAPGKEDTVLTAEGISIFDDEDLQIEAADPLAKTQIAPSLEDQVSLDGVGSGSGLLDLTRESDDTSLGAEIMDRIDMEAVVGSDIGAAIVEPAPAEVIVEQPAYVEALDPQAGLFSGMAVGATIVMLLMTGVVLAVMSAAQVPGYLESMMSNVAIMLVVSLVIVVAASVAGMVIGKPKALASRV